MRKLRLTFDIPSYTIYISLIIFFPAMQIMWWTWWLGSYYPLISCILFRLSSDWVKRRKEVALRNASTCAKWRTLLKPVRFLIKIQNQIGYEKISLSSSLFFYLIPIDSHSGLSCHCSTNKHTHTVPGAENCKINHNMSPPRNRLHMFLTSDWQAWSVLYKYFKKQPVFWRLFYHHQQ